ncbi:DNA mismatch repair protein MutT [Legionella antarctica]|uniref:DNA mismatch repair protein MutT n=1 Tax=Legionella antarctica TaxID=2708020 RepID=A0A6F8T1Q9_9GAMM|nr:NUDIX domain-containing protein [Legionella antarctica]BCA94401.1 DNA mismatch repair protein MutT [Legionella antarctica]
MNKQETILKIGAIIFDENHRLLAVHKTGKPINELIVPGGRMEQNESDEQTLRREIAEELNTKIKTFEYYAEFQAKAIYEDKWLIMRTYIVSLDGEPKPSNEIDRLVWLDHRYQISGFQFASILGQQILPRIFPIKDR